MLDIIKKWKTKKMQLYQMTKVQLIEKAKELNIQVTEQNTRQEIIDLLEANENNTLSTESIDLPAANDDLSSKENLTEKPQGEFGGFETLREYHRNLRERLGSGHIVCPLTGKTVPTSFEDYQ